MGDENPIRTLGYYSKLSHKGYRNTIELPKGNNVVPLRSDTIWLVQSGCLFHKLRSEDPNQHLKDFLKLVDLLDLNGDNRERTRLCLFQFSLHDQASNWLERLLAGSISTWEDLTTRFLTQFFPPGRTCEIDRGGGKLCDKNADKSWEIIENLALYDHEGWNDLKDSIKPIKTISTSQGTSKTLDQKLLELKDQINFLLKGSRPTPRSSSTHIPQAYAEAVYSNPHPQYLNEPPRQTHTERMKRFENVILKQQEEINDWLAEMFGLLKELTTNRDPEKVLIREDAKHPITKNLQLNEVEKKNEAENGTKNKPIKSAEKEPIQVEEEESVEGPNSQPVGYYLNHRINEKLIEELVKIIGPVYEAILKKKITKKEDIGGNFEIPCNIGGLKHMNALVDQGSNVNVMPLSTYEKLTNKWHVMMDVRLSLASHSYIYPLEIAEDVLVDVAGYVYPVDFLILDIKKDEKRPFIMGRPFLTTAKAMIKFDKGTITLRSGKSKMSFHRIPEPLCRIEKGIKNNIEPIAPTTTVNRLVLEWEERIKVHQEKEMKFIQWRSKTFKNKHPMFVKAKREVEDEGEVT
ncbi:MAK10-like protein [Tanacetum coccineum]